ncbi:TorD/DmsD family molecular chaperone [Sphaerochaeta sp.]|uniref:TorD/DmsD family molecular chaperone n=1 Tax=Sphaerochaeta sp. TaxID=1972642 RepID=UPI003D13304B
MKQVTEQTEIMSHRENMYRFLSQLYRTEVDEKIYSCLKNADYQCGEGEDIQEGYSLMQSFFFHPYIDPVTELAVDYAKVFLGAGIIESDKAAYPYESVYTSPKKLIMQDARDEMLMKLREYQLQPDGPFTIPEDHIYIELEFMAILCGKAQQAMDEGDTASLKILLDEQRQFVQKHLMNWVPQFCDDVEKHSMTNFYKGLAKVTGQYIKMDMEIIEELSERYSA